MPNGFNSSRIFYCTYWLKCPSLAIAIIAYRMVFLDFDSVVKNYCNEKVSRLKTDWTRKREMALKKFNRFVNDVSPEQIAGIVCVLSAIASVFAIYKFVKHEQRKEEKREEKKALREERKASQNISLTKEERKVLYENRRKKNDEIKRLKFLNENGYVPKGQMDHSDVKDVDEELAVVQKVITATPPAERIHNKVMPELWTKFKDTTLPVFTGTAESLESILRKNARTIRVYHTKNDFGTVRALMIKADIMITVNHVFDFSKQETNVVCISPDGTTDWFDRTSELKRLARETIVKKKDLVRISDDLVMLVVSNESVKDITKYFTKMKQQPNVFEGFIFGKSVPVKRTKDMIYELEGSLVVCHGGYLYLTDHSYPGSCTTPLIKQRSSEGGAEIVGIHVAGSAVSGYATEISLDRLEKGMLDLPRVLMKQSSRSDIQLEGCELIVKPHPKSLIRYEETSGMDYIGTLKQGLKETEVSHVKRTGLDVGDINLMFFEEFGRTDFNEYGPPLMGPRGKNETYVHPYNVNARNMSIGKRAIDRDILARCVKCYVDRIVKHFAGRKLNPLDLFSAINGSEKDSYLRRIDAAKSAGFGHPGPKTVYLPLISEDGPDREMNEETKKEFLRYLKVLAEDEAPGMIFQGKLKDEAREVSKILEGKTRLFCVSDVISLTAGRMLLFPLFSLIQECNEVWRIALGVDMHRQGVKVFEDVAQFNGGNNFKTEGDYSKFDQCMPFEIGHGAATVIHDVLKKLGYNEAALKMVRGYLTDALFPVVNINGCMFRVPGYQPSGFYDTVSNNSIRGMLMKLYFFAVETGDPENYFKHCMGYVCGDDTIDAVDPEMCEVYNGVTYQKFCKEHYNMPFTPTTKNATIEKFVTTQDMSFLKRKYRFHPVLNRYVAPLDLDSIRKTLMWTIPGKISEFEQIESATGSCLVELFFHCSSVEQYSRIHAWMCALMKKRFPKFDVRYKDVHKLISELEPIEEIPEPDEVKWDVSGMKAHALCHRGFRQSSMVVLRCVHCHTRVREERRVVAGCGIHPLCRKLPLDLIREIESYLSWADVPDWDNPFAPLRAW